jgi:hypothetical protein
MNAELILREICARWDLGVDRLSRAEAVPIESKRPEFTELAATIGHAKQLLNGDFDYLARRNSGRKKADLSGVDWNKSNHQIAAETGLCYASVCAKRPADRKPIAKGLNPIDWNAVDFKRSDLDIAEEFGISGATVHKNRVRLGHHSSTKLTRLFDWASVDWSKNNGEIAAELGTSINNARKYRAKAGRKNPFTTDASRPHRKVTKEMIETANWLEDRDVDICQRWGVTRERVRQLRIENKKPACIYKDRHGLPMMKAIAGLRHELTGLDLAAITNRLTPVVGAIRRPSLISALRFLGVDYASKKIRNKRMKYPYDDMNWELPNCILSIIYDAPKNVIARGRHLNCKPAPNWTMGGAFNRKFEDREFQGAVAQEILFAESKGFNNRIAANEYLLERKAAADAVAEKRRRTIAAS